MTMENREFITPRQLAALLGLTERTLIDWRTNGKGPQYYRVSSRRIRYKLADVHAWMELRKSGRAE